jgi:hypothetical protein
VSQSRPSKRGEDPYHYLDRAFEYYVSGRFAALNQFKIAANLLHHAIEMILKFGLVKGLPDGDVPAKLSKLRNRPYAHDLNELWSLYKSETGYPHLSRFDSVLSELHRWEDLRYGGFPVGLSTAMIFAPRRGTSGSQALEPEDRYVLVLEDIDELFATILKASNINPRFLGVRFHSSAAVQDWYSRENQFSGVFEREPPEDAGS